MSLNWYGAIVALGFVVGLWTASRRAPLNHISGETVFDVGPWLIISSIIGARTLYVITFWREQFAGQGFFEAFKVWQGGLVYYGGLIGACLGCILFARYKKLALWRLADVLAPSIALGQVFGRIGCLLNGCCYGRPTVLPWGICFPEDHATHPAGSAAAPVHPTQVYESVLSLILYAALAWAFRRKKFDGQIFAYFLVGYAGIRAFVELFRGDYPRQQLFFGGAVTPAHLVSGLLLITGLGLLAWFKHSASAAANAK